MAMSTYPGGPVLRETGWHRRGPAIRKHKSQAGAELLYFKTSVF